MSTHNGHIIMDDDDAHLADALRDNNPGRGPLGLAIIAASAGEETPAEDDELADALRRQYYAIHDYFKKVFRELRGRLVSAGADNDGLRTFDTMALALGFKDVAGAQTPAELARRYGKPRETINKPLKEIIARLNLPPLPGQRDEAAVKNITTARHQHKKVKP